MSKRDPSHPICKVCGPAHRLRKKQEDPTYNAYNGWYPLSTNTWTVIFKTRFTGKYKGLEKNFSYSMQYLEFLRTKIHDECQLSSVIVTMNQKTTITTAISVMELLIYCLLIEDKTVTQDEMKNEYKGLKKRIEWTSKNLSNVLPKEWKATAIEANDLRNRVHLFLLDKSKSTFYDHDFNAIGEPQVKSVLKALAMLLDALFPKMLSASIIRRQADFIMQHA